MVTLQVLNFSRWASFQCAVTLFVLPDLSSNDSESSDSDDHEYSEPPLQDEEHNDNDDSYDHEYQQPYGHDDNSDDGNLKCVKQFSFLRQWCHHYFEKKSHKEFPKIS